MIKIKEKYVKDKDCKHSVRYSPAENTSSKLKGANIYIPRSSLPETPPEELTVTVEAFTG